MIGLRGRHGSVSAGRRVLLLAAAALALPTSRAAARSLCETGRRQSPVDIGEAQGAPLPALSFDYRPAPLRAVNDGHTVRVRFAGGSALVLGSERLALQQLHFHRPGGDRLRGEEFPMAVHLLHKSRTGQLAPVVVWFRRGTAHDGLSRLLPLLPGPGEPERRLDGARVDASDFVPRSRGYFSYQGSETAPPCTEGVPWIVMKEALELSDAQLQALGGLVPVNARGVQPLNGRVVRQTG